MEATACRCPGQCPNPAFPIKCGLAWPSLGGGVTGETVSVEGQVGSGKPCFFCPIGVKGPQGLKVHELEAE